MKKKILQIDNARACRFCGFLQSPESHPSVNHPWLSDEHYSAIASVGALVPGWSLICPHSHDINLARHYREPDFWGVVHDVNDRLERKYGTPIQFFEHGPSTFGSLTGCGTDHAHLHAVPLDFSIAAAATSDGDSKLSWFDCEAREISEISEGREYLFAITSVDGIHSKGKAALLNSSISQYFRKVIAHKLHMGDQFDYKHFPMMDIARQTVEDLQNSYPDDLPVASHG